MKYICTICGYIYDEGKEKVRFNDLPEDWTCPLCGALKSDFKLLEENDNVDKKGINEFKENEEENKIKKDEIIDDDMKKLSNGQLSILFSNLARGCQKQYKFEEEKLFNELSNYFMKRTINEENLEVENLLDIAKNDLDEKYIKANTVIEEKEDRGAKRANVWGEKVTKMISSLLNMYKQRGEEMFKDKQIWICTVCGFIYVGNTPPERCPVCKVPKNKLKKVEGRI